MRQETQVQEQLESEQTMQTDATGQLTVETSELPRRVWHAPRVTRIEIKRTMNSPGSGLDGGTQFDID